MPGRGADEEEPIPTRRYDPGRVRGLLIDLGGVVYQGTRMIDGSGEAIARLRSAGLPFRFLTNTTSQPLAAVVDKLARLGVEASADDVFTPAIAARTCLAERALRPYFLVHPSLLEDFPDPPAGNARAVVVGDAREGFTYASLNEAFRHLQQGAELIALAKNRMFVGSDGEPALDVGAFVAALEYASGREAVVLGKPAPEFFHLAAAAMRLDPGEVAMIGDDPEFDVAAAIDAGLGGFLVRTGKASSAHSGREVRPTAEFDDLAAAVEAVLAARTA